MRYLSFFSKKKIIIIFYAKTSVFPIRRVELLRDHPDVLPGQERVAAVPVGEVGLGGQHHPAVVVNVLGKNKNSNHIWQTTYLCI